MAEEIKKKITRKVIKRAVPQAATRSEVKVEETAEKTAEVKAKKTCQFCQSKSTPSYTDTNILKRFLTDRGKILPRIRTNSCSRHQRAITRQIKYARHLALLPFTPSIH